jgi:lipoyl(octanoyl) transferase
MRPLLRDLGRCDYLPTWQAMRDFTASRDPETADQLWIVEHPPVFTLGVAARKERVAAGDIPVVATDRGGLATYHGPGQAVVYTLIDLRRAGIFVKELVYRIEQSVLQTLDRVGVTGIRVGGAPGVYVRTDPNHGIRSTSAATGAVADRFAGLAKIAALGIKVSRGCSYHGVALNVAMDLAPFSRIDPCGYAGLATTDLATLGVDASREVIAQRLAERLSQHLAHFADPVTTEPAPLPR